jgi:hypothetical protein
MNIGVQQPYSRQGWPSDQSDKVAGPEKGVSANAGA